MTTTNGSVSAETIHLGPPKPIGTMSLESQLVMDRLLKDKDRVGAFVPYSELNSITGKDVQKEGRHHVRTAINAVLSRHSVLFAPVGDGSGLKRLSSEEAVEYAGTAIPWIRRKSRRWKRKLTGATFDDLSRERKTEYLVTSSMLGAFQSMASEPKMKALTSAVEKAQVRLPIEKTLELMKG